MSKGTLSTPKGKPIHNVRSSLENEETSERTIGSLRTYDELKAPVVKHSNEKAQTIKDYEGHDDHAIMSGKKRPYSDVEKENVPQEQASKRRVAQRTFDNRNTPTVQTLHYTDIPVATHDTSEVSTILRKARRSKAHASDIKEPRHTRIDDLPCELLVEVMWMYLLDAWLSGVSGTRLWATISLVCKGWRALVQNTPKLWSNIPVDTTSLTLLEAALTCSEATPLCLCGPLTGPNMEKKLELISRASSRIETLEIMTNAIDQLEKLEWDAAIGMPALKELFIKIPWCGAGMDSPSLSRFRSQQLTRLHLQEFTFQSFAPLLHDSITDLSLTGRYISLTPGELLHALAKTPQLRRLHATVRNLGVVVADGPLRQVKLAKLEELHLEIGSADDAMVLEYLDMPNINSAEVTIWKPWEDEDIPQVMASVAPLINRLTATGRGRLAQFGTLGPNVLSMRIFDPETMEKTQKPIVDLRFILWDQCISVAQMAEYLAPALGCVEDLVVEDGSYQSQAVTNWYDLFELMAQVETVCVYGNGIRTMPWGFVRCRPGETTYRPIFPGVESVTLDSIDFKLECPDCPATYLGHLISSFECRGNGNNCKDLTIHDGMNIHALGIDQLREFVEDVRWQASVSQTDLQRLES
ncbi:hypothetical protein NEOLEDRAFT_1173185 [Neolentinus lepideus HHB14362 ss-1]|uniref:Uncharacterized protein n=1 Tax=Neolentinus lepideus HHB14362 ss-1 TaxID=1314782 RepID=A0A165N4C8_9AGAM|nr:hypothetical protein NEOLEDRAFT_1173185 [Neolentinus lepideus HHB14362 ss-1]